MKWAIIIILIILVFFLLRWLLKNYKFKFDNFTFFQGSLGSGKTSILTYFAVKLYKRRKRLNKIIPILNMIMWFIPIVNIFVLIFFLFSQKKQKNYKFWLYPINKYSEDVYSNYPILLNKRKKIYSKIVNTEVLTYIFKINDSSILVLDEVGYLLPNVINGKAVLSDSKLRLCLTYLRHCTNCTCLMASQSLSEVNKTMRAKINHCYNLSSVKVRKMLRFLPSTVHVFETIVSEDVDTVYSDSSKDYVDNVFYFWFPYNRFDSRYARELYDLSQDDLNLLSVKFDLALEKMGLVNGDCWTDIIYHFR